MCVPRTFVFVRAILGLRYVPLLSALLYLSVAGMLGWSVNSKQFLAPPYIYWYSRCLNKKYAYVYNCECHKGFRSHDKVMWMYMPYALNPLRPTQNDRHFADDTLNRIFLNENVRILIKISLKFAPKGPINNIPSLVQIMAWCRPVDKPLSEPMMLSLLTNKCVTRPLWVNKSAMLHLNL